MEPNINAPITDRISCAKVYMEPMLHTIARRVAEKDDATLSSWVRTLILKHLLSRNEIPPYLIKKIT